MTPESRCGCDRRAISYVVCGSMAWCICVCVRLGAERDVSGGGDSCPLPRILLSCSYINLILIVSNICTLTPFTSTPLSNHCTIEYIDYRLGGVQTDNVTCLAMIKKSIRSAGLACLSQVDVNNCLI